MAKGFDTRKLATGKDGRLYISVDGESIWYASVEEFEISMNYETTDFQPAGDWQKYGVPTGVKFTLKFTEAVIRDDLMIKPMLDAINAGSMPAFDFQGSLINPFSEAEETVLCNECIPDGDTNILSVKPGEIVKREFSYIINSVPDMIKSWAEEESA